ncbi:MAG TPA: gluconate 2-dehydrogenase subunit 3 family protein [Nocardioides sp.]|nr:gluconate 2-dehydrogenase subunit 3 family protein [Nocardioides sp.]
MSRVVPGPGRGRFPGFDSVGQSQAWDPVTTGVVLSRLGMAPDIRFFTPAEQAVATVLCDRLLDQRGDTGDEARVPVVNLIDARLAEDRTDGWRYHDMPHDDQAWRDTLAALDHDATERFGAGFATCSSEQQAVLIQAVQDLGSEQWHGLTAKHVWSLWTRYVCTAFYSHPSAWNEMGFPGPAYPRGYKNAGLDAREPFEVRDARPSDDPTRSTP